MTKVSFDPEHNTLTIYGPNIKHTWTVEEINGEKLFTETTTNWKTGKVLSTEKRWGLSSVCSEFNIVDFGGEKVEKIAVECLFLMAGV